MHPGTSLQFQFVAAECSEGKQSYLKKKKKNVRSAYKIIKDD